MASTLDRFASDLNRLIAEGHLLLFSLMADSTPKQAADAQAAAARWGFTSLVAFRSSYQPWYAEARAVVRQLLPDRTNEFDQYYEIPAGRTQLRYINYRIKDAVLGTIRKGLNGEVMVGIGSAIPHLQQQVALLTAAQRVLASSVFDMRRLAQADLFDSELDAARELAENGFFRAAGIIAGVVLERHLSEVCATRGIAIPASKPTMAIFNDALKTAAAIEVQQWRFIQHLADIRNKCGHAKGDEPTETDALDLISGVEKVIKTVA